MEPNNPLRIFPQFQVDGYFVVAAVAFLVFAFAVLVEIYRRGHERRERLKAEWRDVESLMSEKELGSDQRIAIKTLLRKRTPESPFRTVTRRPLFDECIAAEIEAARRKKTIEQVNDLGVSWRAIRSALGLEFVPVGQSITSTRDLYLDQRMWVAPITGREPAHWHNATVTSVNEAHFFIAVDDDAYKVVRDGVPVHCRMWRDDDGRYAFDAQIVRTDNRPASWMMAHTGRLIRTQSREHFRILHEQTAEIAILEAPRNGIYAGMHERDELARVHGRVCSLSGGGFAVTVAQPLPPQVLLRLPLEMDAQAGYQRVIGKVVGSQSLFGGRYLVRCSFVDMSDEQRDVISQYVFRRQTHTHRPPRNGGA